MNVHTKSLLLFVVLGLVSVQVQAQTCCSGGVPLSGNLGLPSAEKNALQFTLSYDLNVLETLKDGLLVLDDASRNRTTHSVLLEVGYSINRRFAVDGFFSYVRQERTINQFGNTNFQFTQGIGDAVILFKYHVFKADQPEDIYTSWQIGAGPKIPLGASDKTNDIGITLNADLQPGSGAWDGVFWSNFARQSAFRPTLMFSATGTYSVKGNNNSYLGSQVYGFGDELQLIAGFSDRLVLGKFIIDPSLSFRYRLALEDKNNGVALANTGGQWIFVVPRLTYVMQENMTWHISTELPIYANITGTQLSPTYRLNTGVYYKFSRSKTENVPIIQF